MSHTPGPTFTPSQIKDWRAFELVRTGGSFNMFDRNARLATGLSSERYSFVMKNYSALRDAAMTKATGADK